MREGRRAAHSGWRGIDFKGSRRVGDAAWQFLSLQPGLQFRAGRKEGEMNALREQYLEICNDLICIFGFESVGHVLSEDASLEECVGYMQEYVVAKGDHFRFDRYLEMLAHCSEHHGSLSASRKQKRTVVHVDVGTGPGIFHWVMHDCVQQQFRPKNRPKLLQFGYDQCPNMLKLAKRIWKEFDLEDKPNYVSDAKQLVKAVRDVSTHAHLIVTFGHVLIQADEQEDEAEITKLARLCGKLSKSKRTTDVIAVDAYFRDRRDQFKHAEAKLFEELQEYSDKGKWHRIKIDDNILWPGSRSLIRNWGES